jgi:hypothetical protein
MTVTENVDAQIVNANRIARSNAIVVGVRHIARIDDRYRSFADRL